MRHFAPSIGWRFAMLQATTGKGREPPAVLPSPPIDCPCWALPTVDEANHAYAAPRPLLPLAAGSMGMVSGIRQRGMGALRKVAASAMIAKRRLTGHCQRRSLLETGRDSADGEPPREPSAATKTAAGKRNEASRMENARQQTFPASDPIPP